MPEILDKESPVALPQQLKNILQERIEGAYYVPGRKIDSVRKIAAEFKVSSLTVQRALKQLESDGFVVSIPASGIFVNEQFAKEVKSGKVAFVFPEAAISREILDPEGWALNSEIYRGLLAGAQEYGVQVSFIHVDKDMEALQMLRQIKKLRKYDALVFAGEQLAELQRELAQEKPVFQFSAQQGTLPPLIDVNYDRDSALETLAAHAKECGCRTIGIISYFDFMPPFFTPEVREKQKEFYVTRANLFLQYCRKHGLETPTEFQWEFDSESNPDKMLAGALKKGHADFVFCNQTYFVRNLYETCGELGIRIGKKLKIGAIATGFTFQGLIPSLTYIRVPMFELAVSVVRDTHRLLYDGIAVSDLERMTIHAPLITGKSTIENKIQER